MTPALDLDAIEAYWANHDALSGTAQKAKTDIAALTKRVRDLTEYPADDKDQMLKIDILIANLQKIRDRWGNTCCYIRRGGLSWGAVALNRQADDEKHGIFDLQTQHDRDMRARLEQIERLIADRDRWMQLAHPTPPEGR